MRETVAEFREVEKVYNEGTSAPVVRALRGVNLTIPRGQYVAIMGPSGSGKSTLMNILGCLDRPTQGSYLIDGEDVAGFTDEELSRARGERLGFVFQAFNLIQQLTIEDNVQVPLFYSGVPPVKRREAAERSLERVGLLDRLGHRPAELSGGQQQRVAIARALVNEPSLLLADEPTGNLDSSTGQAILDMFDQLHRAGLTIVMVTHDESVAERCERIVRVLDGLIDKDEMVNGAV
ncbi:ABC transporter ATP-binding protein [Mucisphaera calidilacus]|uniref:ABC transporter ATP-binding protein n=1 Tax=Mucisphaera calidilacus TaxID=2527982 RepID=A0A518BYQ7_9BACT|nr:ABC transporter ATP-binding protein [Mucisphaera calidilacus]QDU72098.1 ABC transporter ATP-binding protein [Mucisphaera calidilacus]